MRGLSIVAVSAIVSLGGCVQSPSLPVAETTPPVATATTPARPTAPARPAGEATTERPAAGEPDPGPTTAPAIPATPPPPPASSEPAAPREPTAPPQGNASAARSSPAPAPPPNPPSTVAQADRSNASGETPTPTPAPPLAPPADPPASSTPPVDRARPSALDLESLTQRLRETKAIGVFTKLTLKNQVDDLLAEFRGVYRGDADVPIAELRQRYELLLLNVLTLLQDSDRQLAEAITASREAIWGILADPERFAEI